MSPEELTDSPAGRPVAAKVSVSPAAESVAWSCTPVMAVPTVPVWLPGFVTVTVLPLGPAMTEVNDAAPEAPVVSAAETVTLLLPAAVGVPEIRPVEALMDRPAGSPEAL